MILPSLIAAAFALNPAAPAASSLPAQTTIPIAFTHAIDAAHVHAGDAVSARTTQAIRLANGHIIPAGSAVAGHVVSGNAFVFNRAHYAKQMQAQLAIHFDTIADRGQQLPLSASVRALADPLAATSAEESTVLDGTLATTTQIGGDQLSPAQNEVLDRNGDIVGYKHDGGVYAHLIARSGCDATDTEQSVSLFSASACGLYGFTGVALTDAGRTSGTFVLQSNHNTPKIWAHSHALLEIQ